MNQNEQILDYLQKNGSITWKEAYNCFGCTRLPARIGELKDRGIKIKTLMEQGLNRFGVKTRYARYTLLKTPEQAAI